MKNEFMKFIIVGVLNTIHYYSWYAIFITIGQWHYMSSHLMAITISMIASYFFNVYFTYKVSFKWKSFLLFPLTQVGNILIQSFGMAIVVEWLHISSVIAPLLVLGITIPLTFFLTRRIFYVAQNQHII